MDEPVISVDYYVNENNNKNFKANNDYGGSIPEKKYSTNSNKNTLNSN